MFPFRNINNTDPHANIMSDFLLCVRHHSDNLSSIVRSHNQLTNITSDVMSFYYSDRSIVRQTENIRTLNPLITTTTNSSTSTNINDVSNNSPIIPPRPFLPPPPPDPGLPHTPILSSTINRTMIGPRSPRRRGNTRRNRRWTNAGTFPNSRFNPREFINSTLWNSSTSSTPASIQNIVDNTTLCKWKDIKNNETYQNTERCPIDLSVLQDEDYILKITHCSHIFKRTNILRWFALNSKCPVCRFDVTRTISQTIDLSNNTTNNINSSEDNVPISPRNISLNINDNINNIDISDNTLESIRRRVNDLIAQSDISGTSIISADITFEIPVAQEQSHK